MTELSRRDGRGVRSWLLTTDHKRIGVMFLIAVTALALVLGGVFALLLRLELLTPEPHVHRRARPTTGCSRSTA